MVNTFAGAISVDAMPHLEGIGTPVSIRRKADITTAVDAGITIARSYRAAVGRWASAAASYDALSSRADNRQRRAVGSRPYEADVNGESV